MAIRTLIEETKAMASVSWDSFGRPGPTLLPNPDKENHLVVNVWCFSQRVDRF